MQQQLKLKGSLDGEKFPEAIMKNEYLMLMTLALISQVFPVNFAVLFPVKQLAHASFTRISSCKFHTDE
eukprot:scaffold5772_cov145-Skeletonema_menzelii.AAC.12